MQKQIIYCQFIPRLFSVNIDLLILSILLIPVMNFISYYVFLGFFSDFFVHNNIDKSKIDVIIALKSVEFWNYVNLSHFFIYLLTIFSLNTIFIASYFICFWYKLGATPGKILLRMKVVDADNFSKPALHNLIKRFFSYITIIIGVWSMIFGKKHMAFHDKVANTVVIKI